MDLHLNTAFLQNSRHDPSQSLGCGTRFSVELMEHQKKALKWMELQELSNKCRGGILADEQGLGKTFTMIAFISSRPLVSEEGRLQTLVVCPKALLKQWSEEFRQKITEENSLNVHLYYGSGTKDSCQVVNNANVVLTTFGTLVAGSQSDGFKSDYLFKKNWNRIVLDEAQNIKTQSSETWKAAHNLSSRFRWCITGTPIQNGLRDIFSLTNFLRFPIAGVRNPRKIGPNSPAIAGIREDLRKILIRRTKVGVALSLPKRHIHVIHIDFLTKHEIFGYQSLLKAVSNKIKSIDLQKTLNAEKQAIILEQLLRLRHMCVHPFLVDCVPHLRKLFASLSNASSMTYQCEEDRTYANAMKRMGSYFSIKKLILALSSGGKREKELLIKLMKRILFPSTKISAILQKLEETVKKKNGRKTLIFSQWTSALDLVEFHVVEAGYRICRIDGTLNSLQIEQQINQFRTQKIELMLISIQAGGTGLNLVEASQVIFIDQWWNPAVEEQAMDRVHRIGQKLEVHVFFFTVRNSIEDRVREIISRKREVASRVLKNNSDSTSKISVQQEISNLRYLASLIANDCAIIPSNMDHSQGSVQTLPKISNSLTICNPVPAVGINQASVDHRLRRLTDNEEALVESILEKDSQVQVYNPDSNITLGINELKNLVTNKWIHGEVICAYAALLNKRSLHATRFNRSDIYPKNFQSYERSFMLDPYFYTKMVYKGKFNYERVRKWGGKANIDLPNLDMILIPALVNENHWVLGCLHLSEKKVLYLDPYRKRDFQNVIQHVLMWIKNEAECRFKDYLSTVWKDIDRWTVMENPPGYPTQKDDCSCGVFVLYYADFLSTGLLPCFNQSHIQLLRKRAAIYLLKNKLCGIYTCTESSLCSIVIPFPGRSWKQEDKLPATVKGSNRASISILPSLGINICSESKALSPEEPKMSSNCLNDEPNREAHLKPDISKVSAGKVVREHDSTLNRSDRSLGFRICRNCAHRLPSAKVQCDNCQTVLRISARKIKTETPKWQESAYLVRKKFKCEKCASEFNHMSSLSRHKRTHESVSATRPTDLRVKESIQKSYTCSTCNANFMHASGLSRHKRIHRSFESFRCNRCHSVFNRKDNLLAHLKRVHKL